MSEIALRFLLANLAAGAAILLIIALRKPARAAFGARLAYSLWLLIPLSVIGSLLPPRIVEITQEAPAAIPVAETPALMPEPVLSVEPFATLPSVTAPSFEIDPWGVATLVWLLGAIVMLAWQVRNQSRFMADARAGFAGPAVAGFLRPRIVTPSDFEDRFDGDERQVIIAHETIHLRRNDARINALAALLRCVCWFNPLIHIAAHLMRVDQELACDATVVERHPRARAVYANALLKAQLASRPLPLGCYWPAGTEHPLTERVEMLKQAAPSRARRALGASALALLAVGACAGGWSALPPETRLVETPAANKPIDLSALPGFNAKSRIEISGEVIRADTDDPNNPAPDFWLQATEIRRDGGPVERNTQLWRIDMAALRAGLERILAGEEVGYAPPENPSPVGKRFIVSAYGANDPACKPDCLAQAIQIRGVRAAEQYAAQAPSPSPFENVNLVIVRGVITRIDLGETDSHIWVESSGVIRPGQSAKQLKQRWLVIAEGERNAPGWARDPETIGKAIEVRGYSGEESDCKPTCTMNGTAIRQLSGYPMPGITFGTGFWLPPGPPLPELPKAGPRPIRYEPQQQPAWNTPLTLDANSPIRVRGKVEKIDFGDMSYVAFVRATGIVIGGSYFEPNQALWELSPTTFFGDREAMSTELLDKNVEVEGININQGCKPGCRIKVGALVTPQSTEVPAPTQGASHVAQFARWYDTTKPSLVRGRVERIQFYDGMFDAWIRSDARGVAPSRLHQVRSEYRFPRADVERALLNHTVTAAGWRARENINTHCDPVCGMYATDFELPNKARVLPAGEKLMSDPMPDAPPGFRDVFDWNAPVTIEGTITKIESSGAKASGPGDRNLADVVWVETTSVTPASTPGAKASTIWRVVGGGLPPPLESFIGNKITAFGYNAKDTRCLPTCTMGNVEMSVSGRALN